MARILIVDDDPHFLDMMSALISRIGHYATAAATLHEGLNLAKRDDFDIALVDVNLPDGSGLLLLPELKNSPSSPEVLIITGAGSKSGAELAFQSGAWDYLEKPFSREELELSITRALEYRAQKNAASTPRLLIRDEIIGSSPLIKNQLAKVAQAAVSNAGVLIQGETGTGKELFARAIHLNSSRSNNNFVVVDCASIPETLVGNILFGHVKGAYTSADGANEGLIRQADKGTLFLDEIGELSLNAQKSLLRVLQERKFRPIGGTTEIFCNFRLVAATNRNLEEMVKKREFRDDLLYRISSFKLNLPPLHERSDDIKAMVNYFIAGICEKYKQDIKGASPEFLSMLTHYDWPGNVRELYNTIENAIAAAGGDPTLYPIHLPGPLRIRESANNISDSISSAVSGVKEENIGLPSLKDFRQKAIEDSERDYLERLMTETGGDVKKACGVSKLSVPRLYALLKKYGVKKTRL